ncbi:carboxylesterase family protein [Mycolicibacterium sp. S2-37]|uniref:carboxylesterase/lipase family protein n=1 Tax=Mycolicibacterium sp. S2-37 TaxID=2810297 RepID=UPI001A9421D3|nr:carboxylesterase family protein [Mycolicibacterium sp. S2-37]MBO0678933.1 carboxylesterase family protein [Mycolicibacterium sp. S2-37]
MPPGPVRQPRLLALILALGIVVGCTSGAPANPSGPETDPAVVRIDAGALRGVIADDHRLFAGIPYAAPPVGPLRFRSPEPATGWTGERDATRPGPRCVQNPGPDLELGRHTDEDCLTLNIWTPAEVGEKRPVMVWIHGGAFVNGSGNVYDARWLASRGDIVVVTVNYRLGTLGFLAHPSLGADGDVGNYGLGDQQAALRWVRDNISAFGGDPQKVTLAGESAGGMSVCDHLVAPASSGLFRAAIIQSGPCQAQADLQLAQQRSLDYAAGVGCGDPATAADCLRALPTDKLRRPVWFYNIGADDLTGPVTGSAALPTAPLAAFADGTAARVPVLIGSTRDEFTLFVALRYLQQGDRYTAEEYPGLLADTFGPNAGAVADRYPLARYDSPALAYAAAVTDGEFACVGDRMARDLSAHQPVYAYEFNDRQAPTPEPLRTLPFPVGASHSLELRYLFDVGGAPPLSPDQQTLSDQMIDYWSGFVTDGVPASPAGPAWPRFGSDPAGGPYLSLQPDGNRVTTGFADEHQCPFWAGLKD